MTSMLISTIFPANVMGTWGRIPWDLVECPSYARRFVEDSYRIGVWACTLTVPNFGNSAVFVQVVSGVMTQNSLRGVGVESKSSFVINPWFKSRV